MRVVRLLALGAALAGPVTAQKRAMTIDDYLALRAVGEPQLSPDGKWVAYTVTAASLPDNRGVSRVWPAEVSAGQARELTAGRRADHPAGRRADREPRALGDARPRRARRCG